MAPTKRIAADLLPSTKAVVGPLVLDAIWIALDGVDWDKLVPLLLAIVANYWVPDWNPPRATTSKVLSALRPGDVVGPTQAGGRRFVVVEELPGPSPTVTESTQ